MYVIAILGIMFFAFIFLRNLLKTLFSMESYNVHKKRLKQLNFNKREEASVDELIDKVTKPIVSYILPKLKPKNLEELGHSLRMAKWDKYFTPVQYRALNILFKIIAIIVSLLLSKTSLVFAIAWGTFLAFGIDLLFKNSIVNRKNKLMADFPEFIRITSGFLMANMPFTQAVSESIKYVGDEWKPILQKFIIECEMKSVDEALDYLREEVDVFEVKEFVALVKLVMEQGGNAKSSFTAQADKVREMQRDAIALKINKRQMMSTLVQAPLLLCNIIVFGLPTIVSMMSLSSM